MRNLPALRSNSQKLRREMTSQERRLWYNFLKPLPQSVKRQHIIDIYIVDFYIPSAKLVIELDGTQHFLPDGKEYDSERDAYLEKKGCKILRYANSDVDSSFDAVCEDILHHL